MFLIYPVFHFGLGLPNVTDVEQNGLQGKIVGYNFEALKATVHEALTSVSNASIRGFYRLALRAIPEECNTELKSSIKMDINHTVK